MGFKSELAKYISRRHLIAQASAICLGLVISIPGPAQSDPNSEAQQHWRIAQAALKKDDFNVAAEELIEAIKLAPKNALLYYNLAFVQSKQGEFVEAKRNLDRGLQLGIHPAEVNDRAMELLATLTYELRASEQNQGGGGGIPSVLKLMVSGYSDGGHIPAQYTCMATPPPGGSPQIDWSGAPAATMSFALIFHSGDMHPGKRFDDVTQWFAWNIPATATGLPANVARTADLPDGTHQGKIFYVGYNGPCPPLGQPGHYELEVYALDAKLDLPATAGRADLEKALSGHILASGVYNGLFPR